MASIDLQILEWRGLVSKPVKVEAYILVVADLSMWHAIFQHLQPFFDNSAVANHEFLSRSDSIYDTKVVDPLDSAFSVEQD